MLVALSSCLKNEPEILKYSRAQVELEAVQQGAATITIEANFMWSIESTAPWLNVTPNKAVGDKVLEINVSPNTSLEMREASFFIVGEKIRQEIKVRQKGENPMLSLKNKTVQTVAGGGEIEAEISTNLELEIVSSVNWITRVTTKEVTNTKYYFDVKPNTQLTAREGTISFRHRSMGFEEVLHVTQQGEAEDIMLSKTSVEFTAAGGPNAVEITANVPWEAESSMPWLKIIDTKLMEKTSCTFQVEANPRVEPRTAVLTFSKEGTNSLLRTLDVTQAGATPSMTLSPLDYDNLPATASTQKHNIAVTANFNWIVDFSATATWVTDISFDGSVCGFRVQANEEVVGRTTVMLFKQVGGGLIQEFVISQVAATPSIFLLPESFNLPSTASAQKHIVGVVANFAWTVDHSATASWVTDLSFDDNACGFKVQANGEMVARTTTILFKQVGGDLVREFIISQEAAGPTITLDPTGYSNLPATASAQKHNIAVTANFVWTVDHSATASWVTDISFDNSGCGFKVQANETVVPRTTTLLFKQVGGDFVREFVIFQEAGEAVLTVSVNELQFSAKDGEVKAFDVSSNTDYSITSAPDWVHYAPQGVQEIPHTTFTVSAENNSQLQPREGKIIISYGASFKQEILVKQEGLVFTYEMSTSSVKALGGDFSISVKKDFATNLNILNNWITFKGSTVNGEVETYNFTVDVTTTNTSRSGSVQFVRADGLGSFAETLSIGQERPFVAPQDSLVLWQMYILLGGIAWPDRWNGALPVSEWKGVQLSEMVYDGRLRIEAIRRPDSRVAGNLNNVDLENLKYLEVLDLSNNPMLSGNLQKDWNKMEYLKELNLGGCTFVGNIPAEWGEKAAPDVGYHFSALSVLILKNNTLSGVIPSQVQNHANWADWDPAVNILPQKSSYGLLLTPP